MNQTAALVSPLRSLQRLCVLSAVLLLASTVRAETLRVGEGERFDDVESALDDAAAGDVVFVTAGTYEISTLRPPSGVALVGEGPTRSHLFAREGGQAILLEDVSDVRIEGLDIYSTLETGDRTNALFYMEDASDITIRDCFIHDAPNDADVVKLNSTQDLVIEDTVIWNPASRTTSEGFQENLDIRGTGDARITLRGCWLFHESGQGDYLLYAKGGTTDLLWENNIFGPSAGEGFGNVAVESGHLVRSDPTPYESERFVIRNNLFVGLRGTGAFAFAGPNVSLLYNNVFYRNDDIRRSIIELTENPADAGGPGVDLFSFNNIFFENGDRTIYRVRDDESAENLTRDFNLFEASADGGDLDLNEEDNSLRGNPGFVAPAMPSFEAERGSDQIEEVLAGFQTNEDSPARGAGTDVFARTGDTHPSEIAEMAVRNDAFGNTRSAGWDIGLFQSCDGPCTCEPGFTDCSGVCVDLASSPSHCGMCETTCAAGQMCAAGSCLADGVDAGPLPDGGPGDGGVSLDGGGTGFDSGAESAPASGCRAGGDSAPSSLAFVAFVALLCRIRRR